MLDYKNFKKDMLENFQHHNVTKRGRYITIKPNNNYFDYGKGYLYFTDIVGKYRDNLKLVGYDHFNTFVYSVCFEII